MAVNHLVNAGQRLKRFVDLNEQEVLALAISNEDEDDRIYHSFADGLRGSYPETALMYDKMAPRRLDIAICCSIFAARNSAIFFR